MTFKLPVGQDGRPLERMKPIAAENPQHGDSLGSDRLGGRRWGKSLQPSPPRVGHQAKFGSSA